MKFNGEMPVIAADVGQFFKHSHRKVVLSGLMVTLSLVGGKHAVFVILAPQIFLDIWLGEQMLEISGELALLVHIRCQEGDDSSLHFAIGHSIRELSLCLMQYVGPTWAQPIEQQPSPILSTAARQSPNVPSPLSCATQPH